MYNDYNHHSPNYGDMRSVSTSGLDARVDFIRKTYAHLGAAIAAFAAFSVMLFQTGIAHAFMKLIVGVPYIWLLVIGVFALIGFAADWWASNVKNPAMQYVGLAVYVIAEAFIFVPLLYIAAYYSDPMVLPAAAITTLTTFAGLTVAVFVSKKDFSFLRTGIIAASFLSLGVIVVSILFGFSLGVFFSAAMVLLAAACILYQTSNIIHHYDTDQHVAASLALFSSIALLFFYILRIFLASRN